MKNKSYHLIDIAHFLELKLIGDAHLVISSMSNLSLAKGDHIAYIGSKKYLVELKKTQAGAVILPKNLATYYEGNQLISDNPELSAARCSQLFSTHSSNYQAGYIAPTAKVDPSATIHPSAYIGAYSIIEAGACIGQNTIVKYHCTIGENTSIGEGNFIHSYADIAHCQIGHHNVIGAHSCIGSAGFGNVRDKKQHWQHICHFGLVILGNHIHIGTHTTIDRGRFENTIIADGVRLDNLIHIAHNVCIGKHSAIAAGTKIAGSTKVGQYCMIGGMVGIINHLNIVDNVIIYPGAIIRENILEPGEYLSALPTLKHRLGLKLYSLLKNDKIAPVLKKLIKRGL